MKTSGKVLAAIICASLILVAGTVVYYEMNRTEDAKVLTVATNPDYPNYEYLYEKTGEYAGIDMDIMRAVCMEIGYVFNPVSCDFGSIIDGVAEKKYDVGASAITITDERKEIILFSNAYEDSNLVVVANLSAKYTSVSDLYNLKVGVQKNSVAEEFVNNDPGFNKTRISTQASSSASVSSLLSGNIDCVIMDQGPAQSITSQYYGQIKVMNILDTTNKEFYGFAINKENPELKKQIDDALEKLLANGTISKIKMYYSDAQRDKPSYFSQ